MAYHFSHQDFEPERPASSDEIVLIDLARSSIFSTKEKIELLRLLKAEVTSEQANPAALGIDAIEIDDAIENVRRQAERGESPDPVAASASP